MLLGSGVAGCDATDITIDTDDLMPDDLMPDDLVPDELVADGRAADGHISPEPESEPDASAAARFGVADCHRKPRIARLMRRLQPITRFRTGMWTAAVA